jgi:hypothetical protein
MRFDRSHKGIIGEYMLNLIRELWQTSKVLLLSSIIYIGCISVVLINTTIGYLSLKTVQGTIKGISLDQNKATILKFSLQGDKNIYYQKYERRLFDHNSDKVKNQYSVHFRT